MMERKLVSIVSAFVLAGTMTVANAQEVTLRAVTSFAEGTQFSKNFERFIEKVNKDGKGVIQINYIGGPRAIPPFEVGECRALEGRRHRQRDRRLLHQPDAGGGRLQADQQADGRAARRTAPGPISTNCTTRSSIPIISPASSSRCRSTSISTRRSTRSIFPA